MKSLFRLSLMGIFAISSLLSNTCYARSSSSSSSSSSSHHEKEHYDYVIVGLGTAGATLARYLSDDCKSSVLVLEAGANYSQDPVILAVGGGRTLPAQISKYNINMAADAPSNSQILEIGSMWGGSSAHNYLQVVRGSSAFWDKLAATSGNLQWSYANILPYLKFLETYQPYPPLTATFQRGTNGNLINTQFAPISSFPADIQALAASSALNAAAPLVDDYNTAINSTSTLQSYQDTAVTSTARRSFSINSFLPTSILSPDGYGVGGRKLRVLSNASAQRVLFHKNTAIGVAYSYEGEIRNVYAKQQVILCAGPFSSVLLELSGVGNRQILEPLGIPVVYDNPNVGENFQCTYAGIGAFSGPTTISFGTRFQTMLNSTGNPNSRDLQWTWSVPGALFTYNLAPLLNLDLSTTSACYNWLIQPRSKGSVHINSSDPLRAPTINFGTFTDGDLTDPASDASVCVRGYRIMKTVVEGAGYSMAYPDAAAYADPTGQALLDAAANTLVISNHYASLCSMSASAATGVVSSKDLHVWGTKHLMVADISVSNPICDGNTAYTAYLFGLKAAAILGHDPLS